MSKPSKKRLDKKKRRERALRKKRNVEHNMAEPIWRLDVFMDDKWYTARRYRRVEQLNAHIEDTERRRRAGEVIIPGKVIEIRTGKVVREIAGSSKVAGPMDAKASKTEAAPSKVEKPDGWWKKFVKGKSHDGQKTI